MHGTTIAVNTLIQRTGARLGLLVTEGFRDVLELQRLRLPNPFDLDGGSTRCRWSPGRAWPRCASASAPTAASTRRSTTAACATAARRLAAQGVEGLVVSLLHAYRNAAHERQARALAETAAPGLPVSTSSDVWPQAREYERTALAVLDAYVQPKVRRYLEGFEQALAARGVPAAPHVTKSNGGIMPVAAARQQTVATLLSGPASGVIGAAYVAGARRAAATSSRSTWAGPARTSRWSRTAGRAASTSEHVGGVPVMMPVVGVTRHRRGRRLGRLGGRGRRAQGRPAEHRRPSRSGLLRTRRQGRHAHRRVRRLADSSTPSGSSAGGCGCDRELAEEADRAASPIRSA